MLSQKEFDALIDDAAKAINGDITWTDDEDHSPTVEFRVEVESLAGYPLFVRGSFNRLAKAGAFALIHRSAGRIYCLCLGKEHRNPSGEYTGKKHKHKWTERFRDKEAYVPEDISGDVLNLPLVWQQFCAEAKISHNGVFHTPPGLQEDLFG